MLAGLLLGVVSLVVSLGLIAQFAQGQVGVWDSPLALGPERTVGNWLSGAMLLAGAVLLGLIGLRSCAAERAHWFGLAAIVLYMAADDAFSLHEMADTRLNEVWTPSGPLASVWVVPAIGAVMVCAVVFGRFVLALDRSVRRLLTAAAGIFVGAAIGLEMIAGILVDNRMFVISLVAEEVAEMFALVLMLYGLLLQLGELEAEPVQGRASLSHLPPLINRPVPKRQSGAGSQASQSVI
jgi:hypothetical protein